MAAVENTEWLNQNMLRAYPVHENADTTPILASGAVATGLKLPTCLITDFSFTLAFDATVYDGSSVVVPALTGLTHASDGFSFEISLGSSVLAVLTVSKSSHSVNASYRLQGKGDNADCGGWITLGDLTQAADELPEGVYRFDANQVPFEISTLRMAPRGIRSITAVGKYGLKTYDPLYGNVKIIAGSDMSVRNSTDNNAIWLQAESNTGYERTSGCACGQAAKKTVTSINGMSVDSVFFTGDATCIGVETTNTSTSKTVKITDQCATPCCGCSELNFVESAIATINKSISVLNGYAESLQSRLTELTTNLTTTKASIAAYPGALTASTDADSDSDSE